MEGIDIFILCYTTTFHLFYLVLSWRKGKTFDRVDRRARMSRTDYNTVFPHIFSGVISGSTPECGLVFFVS